jgi:hypothetical protein
MRKEFFISALVSIAIGTAAILLLKHFGLLNAFAPHGRSEKNYFLAGAVLGLFIALTAHELGHLVAGLLAGFTFNFFIVGLIGIKRVNGKLKVYLNTNPQFFGGIVSTLPTRAARAKRAYARLLIAGPAGSLGLGVLGLAGVFVMQHPARMFLEMCAIYSLAIFGATTLPRRSSGFLTDRARFQRLMSGGKAAAVEAAIVDVIAEYNTSRSYTNLDLDTLRLIQSDDEPINRFVGHFYAQQYFLERGDEQAAQHEARELDALRGVLPAALFARRQ